MYTALSGSLSAGTPEETTPIMSLASGDITIDNDQSGVQHEAIIWNTGNVVVNNSGTAASLTIAALNGISINNTLDNSSITLNNGAEATLKLDGAVENSGSGNIGIINAGTLNIDGRLINMASGNITVTNLTGGTLNINGDVYNLSTGTISLTDFTRINGNVVGENITLIGNGTVDGSIVGNIYGTETLSITNTILIDSVHVGTDLDPAGNHIIAGAGSLTHTGFGGNTNVTIKNDSAIYADIFGGGSPDVTVAGTVTLNIGSGVQPAPGPMPRAITTNVTSITGDVYGGGLSSLVTNSIAVNLIGTTLNPVILTGNLYGGSKNGNVYGDVTIKVSGSPSTAEIIGTGSGNIYGGSYNGNIGKADSARKVNITINGGWIGGNIYAAGYRVTPTVDNGNVYGSATVTFQGTGSNLQFTGSVNGEVTGGGKVVAVSGESTNNNKTTLKFDGFTGDFNGTVNNFSTMYFNGTAKVTMASNSQLNNISNYTFDYGSLSSPGSGSLILTDMTGAAPVIEKISVIVAPGQLQQGQYVLVSGSAAVMDSFNLDTITIFNPGSTNSKGTIKVNDPTSFLGQGSYNVYAYTTGDGKLVLGCEPPNTVALSWPTDFWSRSAPDRAPVFSSSTTTGTTLGTNTLYRYVDSAGTTSVKAHIATGASGEIHGGADSGNTITGSTWLNVTGGTGMTLYGGGSGGTIGKNANIYIYGSTTVPGVSNVYGGGSGTSSVTNTYITIAGGNFGAAAIYGGGNGASAKVTGNSTICFAGLASVLNFTGTVHGDGSTAATVSGTKTLIFGDLNGKTGVLRPFAGDATGATAGTFNGNFTELDKVWVKASSNVLLGSGTVFRANNWDIAGKLDSDVKNIQSYSGQQFTGVIEAGGNLKANFTNAAAALNSFSLSNAGIMNFTSTETNARIWANNSIAVSNTGTGAGTLNGRLVTTDTATVASTINITNDSSDTATGLVINGTWDAASLRNVAVAALGTVAGSSTTLTNGSAASTNRTMTVNGAIYALSVGSLNVNNYGTLSITAFDADNTSVRSAINSVGPGGVNIANHGTFTTSYIRNEWNPNSTAAGAGNMVINNTSGTMTVNGRLMLAADSVYMPLTGVALTTVMGVITGQLVASDNIGTNATQTITNAAGATFTANGAVVNALSQKLSIDNSGIMNIGVNSTGYHNSLYNYNSVAGIDVANRSAGVMNLYGNIRNDGTGAINIVNYGGQLTIHGDVRNTTVNGTITVVDYNQITGDVSGQYINLFGSGTVKGNVTGNNIDPADATATTKVVIAGGNIGATGKKVAGVTGTAIAGNTSVNISGTTTVNSTVYGAGDGVTVAKTATVSIGGATGSTVQLNANLYGGGRGATATGLDAQVGAVSMTLMNGTTMALNCNTFGGGFNAKVSGNVTVNMTGGTHQFLYGGGYNDGTGNADVLGSTSVTVTGGTALRTYGGGHNANVTGDTNVTLGDGTTILSVARGVFAGGYGNANVGGTAHLTVLANVTTVKNIHGGGLIDTTSATQIVSTSQIKILGGTINGYVFGGGLANGAGQCKTTTVTITISGGNFTGRISGGGSSAISGSTTTSDSVLLAISGGVFNDLITGGGVAVTGSTAKVENVSIVVSGGSFNNCIYGGGFSTGGSSSVNTVNMTISGGTFYADVVGGGVGTNYTTSQKATVANVSIIVDTTQNVFSFNNKNIYCGGSQQATVSGTTSLTIKGGVVSNSLNSLATISGDGVTNNSVGGTKTLIFDGYQNSLSTKLLNFNKVSLLNGAQVSLNGAQDLTLVNNWQLAADNTPTTALLDWGNATNSFQNDTMAFDVTGWTSPTVGATQTLMHGAAAAFTGWSANMTVSIAGVSAAWDNLLNGWKTANWSVSVEAVGGIAANTILKLAKIA